MIVYSNLYATNIVIEGVHWANIHFGAEWVWHIDLDRLNIGDGQHCILGQMYAAEAAEDGRFGSGWRYAMQTGIMHWERAYDLGLSVRYDHVHHDEWVTNVRTINAAWRAQILKLRQSVPAPIVA